MTILHISESALAKDPANVLSLVRMGNALLIAREFKVVAHLQPVTDLSRPMASGKVLAESIGVVVRVGRDGGPPPGFPPDDVTDDGSGVVIPSYTVLFEPQEDGGYLVTCPALPGLVTDGRTLIEARAMAHDAIRGYLESLIMDRQPIPDDGRVCRAPCDGVPLHPQRRLSTGAQGHAAMA